MPRHLLGALAALALGAGAAGAQATGDAPVRGNPVAIVDLRTAAGAALVGAAWRYADARVVEVDHRGPGPDLRPSGPPVRTLDIEPKAGAAGFDDAAWPRIPAESLEARRGNGRLSFGWYRTTVTIPATLGRLDAAGLVAVFEVVVDDYAEVWVNGELPRPLGQAGGPLVKGFNAPNRVILSRHAKPGERFEIAVFAMNGPVSSPPGNFLWIRSATLDFYRPVDAPVAVAGGGRVVRLDPALDAIVAPGAGIEKLAGGFQFTEGPVWVPEGGYLLFSDPNANTIWRWAPADGQVSVFRTKSGYAGLDVGEYHQPGSNGLALDPMGRLTIDQHGERRVVRMERTGAITVLADRYEGKRLNSPNDLVYRSDGALYVTDPPFGLPKAFDDPRKELAFSGVYLVKDGAVTLLTKELSGPNGIAFSPDERYLYVGNWDLSRKVVMRYPVRPDGTIGPGTVFLDLTRHPTDRDVAIDGIKVDERGDVFVSGPGGIWIVSPAGKVLGRLEPPEHDANLAWGDADGRTLFLTASTGLYRIRLEVAGAGRAMATAQR